MSLGTAISDIAKLESDKDGSNILAWIIIFFVLVMVSLNVDRYRSWEIDDSGTRTNTKRMWVGVIIPNVCSLLVYMAYSLAVTGNTT